jgi:prevent-host-death family protein
MKESTLTVTEASRNFADCVNRAYYQGATFVVTKNGVPFARIGPPEQKRCTGKELAEALKEVRLSDEERIAFAEDIRRGRETLKSPEEAWE